MEPFFELVPLTEIFDFTVLLVLYFFVGYMVAFFDEPHAPNPQLATSKPATKMSDIKHFEPFFISFILFIYFLIFK